MPWVSLLPAKTFNWGAEIGASSDWKTQSIGCGSIAPLPHWSGRVASVSFSCRYPPHGTMSMARYLKKKSWCYFKIPDSKNWFDRPLKSWTAHHVQTTSFELFCKVGCLSPGLCFVINLTELNLNLKINSTKHFIWKFQKVVWNKFISKSVWKAGCDWPCRLGAAQHPANINVEDASCGCKKKRRVLIVVVRQADDLFIHWAVEHRATIRRVDHWLLGREAVNTVRYSEPDIAASGNIFFWVKQTNQPDT